MKIAVIGAGFAGLGLTAALLEISYAGVMVDLFDPVGIGEGVSGLSSGLLHPFAGLRAKRLWKAEEGLKATHRLLTEANRALGHSCVRSKGILRPAVTEEQQSDYYKSAQMHDQCEWWDKKHLATLLPNVECTGALFVKEGLTLEVKSYLKGLFQACALKGARHIKKQVKNLEELKSYDHIVFALGASTLQFVPLVASKVKGQLIEIAWPKDVAPLPFSLVSKGYITMGANNKTAFLGATFERDFTSEEPDPKVAASLLKEKVGAFLPCVKEAPVLNTYAGVRLASKKNHLPILGKLASKYWVFTALGSKGLLYHAWLGRCLAQALLDENPEAILPEVSLSSHLPSKSG